MPVDRVYMDTNCFIEAMQFPADDSKSPHAPDLWFVRQLLQASKDGQIEVVTSYLTLVECRGATGGTIPSDAVKKAIRSVLESGKVVKLAQLTRRTADIARDLHWVHGINLGGLDAVHVATAKASGCRELVSLDFGKSKSPVKNAGKIQSAIGLRVFTPSKSQCLPFEYLQQPLKESKSSGK